MDFGWLDWLIIGILVFVIVAILIGKGDEAMRLFNGKNWENDPSRPKYDKKKQEKAILIFCIIMLVCELAMKYLAPYWTPLIYILIGIIVLTLIGVMYYLRKYATIDKK
jgi:uncharacterized membrane-anchored protein